MTVLVVDLAARLQLAWDAETSASPLWTRLNPALGQCAVTALVVQDHLGGVLMRGLVVGQSHYWNRLPDGTELDLTRQQFPPAFGPTDVELRSRDYVLGSSSTTRRYELLRSRVRL